VVVRAQQLRHVPRADHRRPEQGQRTRHPGDGPAEQLHRRRHRLPGL